MLAQAFRHRYVYDVCFTSLWYFLTGIQWTWVESRGSSCLLCSLVSAPGCKCDPVAPTVKHCGLNQNMRIIYMRKIAPAVKHCGLRQNMRIINGDGQSLRTLLSKILTLHFLEPPRFLCLTKNWSLRTHNNPSTLRTAHYFTPKGVLSVCFPEVLTVWVTDLSDLSEWLLPLFCSFILACQHESSPGIFPALS